MNILRILRHLFRKSEPFHRLEQVPTFERDWACTADFSHSAKNHCFVVCICNLLLWLFPEQKLQKDSLFQTVHHTVGNGPIFSMKKAQHFFRQEKLPLESCSLYGREELKAALKQGKPCLLLLALRPWSWHWVLALDWLERDGKVFLRILDSWNPQADRLYRLPEKGEYLAAWSVKRK